MGLRHLFDRHVSRTNPSPMGLEIARAEGVYLYTPGGDRILDFNSGISVSNVGHSHQDVVRAVREQAAAYMHTMVYGEHIQAPQVMLASALTDMLPAQLDSVYFVNSGSEAIEGAMKLAKRVTGRPNVVAARHSYHGSTHGAESLRSDREFTMAYRPAVPGIRHIGFNSQEDLEWIDDRVAAVIIEVVQAEAGVVKAATGYLEALRKRCDEMGVLLVFDEVQTACGRTGKRFAFEHYGVAPDILCLAKAFGGGMPLGAFVARRDMMEAFCAEPVLGHITTFGGHPVSCAASLAALKIWSDPSVLDRVSELEEEFHALVNHESIKEVRSAGLMIAIDLEDPERVQRVYQAALKKGLMLDWFLFNQGSIRVAPPIVITESELGEGIGLLISCLDQTG
jgi:acetylornithine/succinyldiaminopimelate/putrescine aminotransferase